MNANNFQITDFSNDTRYAYAVAQVRVLESHLLSNRKFLRLSEKNNWSGVLDELRGTEYYDAVLSVQNEIELENAVSFFIHERHKKIMSLAIEPHIVYTMMLYHDLNNLRIILRQKWNLTRYSVNLSSEGQLSETDINDFLDGKKIIEEPYKVLIPDIMKEFESNKSVFRVDMLISKFYLMNLYRVLINTKSSFLKYFIKYRIDLVNMVQLLRWKYWNKETPIDWNLIFAGGFLDLHFLKKFASAQDENILKVFQYTPYFQSLSEGLNHYLSTGEMWMFEKLADDYLTKFCGITKYTSFGIEPLIAYLWTSLQELKNIHMILMAKYYNVRPDIIKKRLRITYG